MEITIDARPPAWDYMDFEVGDDGMVVATLGGDFPDPKRISAVEAESIVNHPWFEAVLKQAIVSATGTLREAFERTMRGDRQVKLKFENSATFH
jgi:hypothetical protein